MTLDPDVPPLSAFLALFPLAAAFAPDPATIITLVVFVLLLLASAIFSGSEVALFSLDGATRESLAEAEDRASRRVLTLLERPRQILITILLLNTLVNVTAAILAALMTEQLAESMELSQTVVLILEVVVLTFVLLVVSEITPKLIATQHAVAFSKFVSGPLLLLHRFFYPLSSMLASSMQGIQQRLRTASTQRFSSDDLKAMAAIGQAHGTLEDEERELINSIVEFGDTSVREIMVSRLDMVALPVAATLSQALDLIRTHGHSRLPMYVDHLDSILGVIYAKDLLPYLKNGTNLSHVDWTRLMRPPMFVPLGRKLDNLLKDFQRKKTHLAIVVDEYGGTAGLVTLEDVLEEIVGDIRDEHDEPEDELYRQIDDHTYHVDARIDLDDLNELLDIHIDTESFDFETLGGLIFHITGEIPSEGDEVSYPPLALHVQSVENNRIGMVEVTVDPTADAGNSEDGRMPENQ